ncbi:MAG TPA: hypothetical protein H9796_09300 [Candidatus Butyricimonas faecavium]|nr:hypothetical protein [Candidatus Butyricimonas faecavium]
MKKERIYTLFETLSPAQRLRVVTLRDRVGLWDEIVVKTGISRFDKCQ